ncbi:MAG: CinA family protein [Sphingomonadaceae bacterium]|nr:CinA family protein [Sphingomonadaceae bacterium]
MSGLFDDEIIALARRVVEMNAAAGRKVVLAESCTGGLVCGAITEIAGSSAVLERGFVTYSNEAKTAQLDVHGDVLETFGAVSVATAWAMAQGALAHSEADVAVAITGIAGPDGGSESKPVGTVVFARAIRDSDPEDVVADMKQFGDLGRTGIRLQAVRCALELLLPEDASETPPAAA